MAICCGKIDKTMRAGKIKSLVYFILFMGLLGVSAIVMSLWSILRRDLKAVPKILISLWVLFLWESRRLTLISPEKKARISGKIFRFSPPLSGYFFKYFDSLLIFSFFVLMITTVYSIVKLSLHIL